MAASDFRNEWSCGNNVKYGLLSKHKEIDKTIFFNFKKLTKFTFEAPHILNKCRNYHQCKSRKSVCHENFVENEKEHDCKTILV